jgi:DNA-binding NarL/FixJ family response regulator
MTLAARVFPKQNIPDYDRELLNLLAAGLTVTEISLTQQTSVDAITKQIASICEIMGAENEIHAVAMAIRAGWITGEVKRN